ncbi:MAG TPA: paraslipin [Hyphomicrobiaceae bacterium]|nr:paraslipin [Hyphomicrobiaceae bacterium]
MPFDFISGGSIVLFLLAIFIIISLFLGVRIVPQSQKYVIERFGRLRAVLGPGINLIVPFVDTVAHKVSILERQLPNSRQDAITTDNVLVQVETSVFYRIMEPEKTVYRIRDVDAAILTTVAGIVRSEIGTMELDEVQSNRARLTTRIREAIADVVDDWGIEVTRAELLDVNLDEATRTAMLQQLNAERARRAPTVVTGQRGVRARGSRAGSGTTSIASTRARIVEGGVDNAKRGPGRSRSPSATTQGEAVGERAVGTKHHNIQTLEEAATGGDIVAARSERGELLQEPDATDRIQC